MVSEETSPSYIVQSQLVDINEVIDLAYNFSISPMQVMIIFSNISWFTIGFNESMENYLIFDIGVDAQR